MGGFESQPVKLGLTPLGLLAQTPRPSCGLRTLGLSRLEPNVLALGAAWPTDSFPPALCSSQCRPSRPCSPTSVTLHVPTCLLFLRHSLPSSLQHALPPVLLCVSMPRSGLHLYPSPPVFLGWKDQESRRGPCFSCSPCQCLAEHQAGTWHGCP